MTISGLLSSTKHVNQKREELFDAEIQKLKNSGKDDDFIRSNIAACNNLSYNNGLTEEQVGYLYNQPYIGTGTGGNTVNAPGNDILNKEYRRYIDGIKPSPNINTLGQYNDIVNKLGQYTNSIPKFSFMDLLNSIFDTSEKEQFLLNLGFEFVNEDGKDWIQRTVLGYREKGEKNISLDIIFLREITIKFKNLLLAKATLKLKI